MLNSYNHIISTFNWNTYLDERERANELQSRLSAWSGINMQKEINEVFNKLCPPDQTWRIDLLEIDLGIIEMDTLESNLARRLRVQLTEKLTDLIVYAGKAGQDNIEITNQHDAPIDKIRSYLLNGVMPWSYKASDGSFNQILSWQFQHNRQVIIAMLKETGVAHEDVRKRMAWQMNDSNIQKTIEGFEPGNHEQIARFSTELIKVQTKENVVRVGTVDFKKNVSLWILNYLFTERGTLFNKLAFLKSSIVQMAGHYNISYTELLQLLNEAVGEMTKSTTVKADFLLSLKSLSKEDSIAEIKRRFADVPGMKVDDKTARLLVNSAKSESFISVQGVLNELLSSAEFIKLAKAVKPRVPVLLLEAIIKYRAKNEAEIFKYVLEKLLFFTPLSHIGQFSLFIEKLAVDKRISKSGDTIEYINKLSVAYRSAFIKKNVSNEDARLINTLLPGGPRLIKQLDKEYIALLQPALKSWTKHKISSQLKEILWHTILDYASHKGNVDSFRKAFTASLVFHLPITKSQLENSPSGIQTITEEQADFCSSSGEKISFTKVFLLIEKCLEAGTASIVENGNTFTLQEMVAACLEHYSTTSGSVKTLKLLFEILICLVSSQPPKALIQSYWKQAASIIKGNRGGEDVMMELVQETFQFIIHKTNAEPAAVITAIRKNGLYFTPYLLRLLKKCLPAFDIPELDSLISKPSAKLLLVYRKGLMAELIQQLIIHQHLPSWFKNGDEDQDIDTVMQDIIIHYPEKFLFFLKKEPISEPQLTWIGNTIHLGIFIRAISFAEKNRQPALTAFEKFYSAIENISLPGINSGELKQFLFKKLILALTTNNWKVLSAEQVWEYFVHEFSVVANISKTVFMREMIKHRHHMPPVFQLSLEKMQEDVSVKPALPLKQDAANKIRQLMKTKDKSNKTGTPVRNAGIVLLNSYIAMLFERLDLIKDRKFKDESAQQQAIHYLQYVATGMFQSDETELALNKVLCGVAISQPVYDSIEVSEENKNLVDGLIRAAINYWPAIGDCSIEGFRGNWLVRNASLTEHEDKWELIVEKRAYDILINHSPFSFSIIKYAWMNKPLHVNWPY